MQKIVLTKQQQQIAALGVALAVIIGALIFMYYDRLLPKPVFDRPVVSAQPHMNIQAADPSLLFERADFKSLRPYGEVPVKVLPGNGNSKLFVVME